MFVVNIAGSPNVQKAKERPNTSNWEKSATGSQGTRMVRPYPQEPSHKIKTLCAGKPKLYGLPKMHKLQASLRPIVACINFLTYPSHQVCEYTDLPTGWTHFILHQEHQTICGTTYVSYQQK